VFHGSGGGGGNNSKKQKKKKKRSVEETRSTRTTRDPTDLVTKSGHEKKAEQNPFLLPTSDKIHKQTHTSDKTHAQNTAPNSGPQFNPNRR
jgi:hypothetical protein